MEDTIGWGILGLGNIARSFARDLRLVKGGKLVAAASRNLEKAYAFQSEFPSEFAFGSYEELLRCEAVDVVYIATPHTSHAALSIQAMEHGKHVLCEKPMGVNATEVEAMTACARKNGVFLMEALWSRFNPSILKVKELVESGAIGELKYLHATFGFYALDRDPTGRLLNPALAGGSLLDIGIYPAFLAYLMLGNPDRVLSSAITRENGVDFQTGMIFEYPESQALLFSGLSARTEMRAELAGTKGNLYLEPRWHETNAYTLVKDGTRTTVDLPTVGKGYSHEIEEVHQCLQAGAPESSRWSLKNSLDLIRLLDTVREQQKLKFPFEE